MLRILLLIAVLIVLILFLFAQVKTANSSSDSDNKCTIDSVTDGDVRVLGSLIHHPDFESKYIAARNVDVWLPADYNQYPETKYAVLYMHDGQNLFEPEKSFIGVDWGIDEAMTRLINKGQIKPAIVVGIWNSPKRRPEYCPQKPFEKYLSQPLQDELQKEYNEKPFSDQYLKFIVEELKPFIDANYRTLTGNAHTFIMGSSMGGLISAYAVCEYPDVFGGAGCVSTHWPAGNGMLIDYLADKLPDPDTHKFYFDYGTETIDAAYEPYQLRADQVMEKAGYTKYQNWITRKFSGDEHSERAWRKRVHIPLEFLLSKS